MVTITVLDMAYSDRTIYEKLLELTARYGPDVVISQAIISEAASVPRNTTIRALKRLQEAGLIEGVFTIGYGYKYRLNDPSGAEANPVRA